MKRVLLILSGLVMAFFLGRMVFLAFVSDETKIRWLVLGMEEGYNDGDVSDSIGPLHANWRHEGYELDRDTLKLGLFQEFRDGRDGTTKELKTRVALDAESIAIQVDGDEATLSVEATFSRHEQGTWKETWRMRVEADLERGEDGWRIVKSRHQDLAGTQLSR